MRYNSPLLSFKITHLINVRSRKNNIDSDTFHAQITQDLIPKLSRAAMVWRAKFGEMDASLMARLRELGDENRRLKKMYAEERLKAELVKDALTKKW